MESIIPLDVTVMNFEMWQEEPLAECHSHWLIGKGVWCDCLKQSTEGQHGPIPSANRTVESSQSCMTASSSNPDSSVYMSCFSGRNPLSTAQGSCRLNS